MNQFIAKMAGCIEGVISGFDRLVFRGRLRRRYQPKGREWYLCQNKILIKDYGQPVEKVRAEWKESAIAPIRSRPGSEASE